MSVSIIRQPQLYTPSDNPILFQFGTTYSNALYFNVNLKDVDSNSTIINDKAYVTPLSPTMSDYNISDVLGSTVRWQIDIATYSTMSKLLSRPLSKYTVNVSPYGLVGNTVSQLGSTTSISNNYVWYGKMNRNDFYRFTYFNYVLTSLTSSVSEYLTKKPDYISVNNNSFEQLYFISASSSQTLYPSIEAYYDNTLVGTYSDSPITSPNGIYRLDVSPRFINSYITAPYNRYSISVKNAAGDNKLRKRWYKHIDTPCGVDVMNVIWVNKLGGLDSHQFLAPIESREATRTSYVKGIYNYDRSSNVLYNSEEVINVSLNSTYKLWSNWLTDDESYWIAEILESKQVYIEMNDEYRSLYPVVLVDTNYTINKRKYNKSEPLQAQFTFKVTGDCISNTFLDSITTTTTSTTTTTTTIAPTTTTSTTTTTTTGTFSTTTTSTTTTTTTLAPATISIDNNVSIDVSITDVRINGISLTGATFPVTAGNSTTGTSAQLGSYTMAIYYTATTGAQSIRIVDSDLNFSCRNVGGGVGSSPITQVVTVTSGTTLFITTSDVSC